MIHMLVSYQCDIITYGSRSSGSWLPDRTSTGKPKKECAKDPDFIYRFCDHMRVGWFCTLFAPFRPEPLDHKTKAVTGLSLPFSILHISELLFTSLKALIDISFRTCRSTIFPTAVGNRAVYLNDNELQ